MSDFFPKWTNRLPLYLLIGLIVIGGSVFGGVWYYFTPKYSRVGYQPVQPVAFSHRIHVEQVGLDCRYCHDGVEKSWFSNIPSPASCMNCHNQVLAADPRLELVREAFETGRPISWVQVHKVPDFVYFNHAVHVNRGISCVHCHGQVNFMDEVRHETPLSMAFCLDCHRNPSEYIRPLEEVFNLNWRTNEAAQKELGLQFTHEWKINATHNCSACHR